LTPYARYEGRSAACAMLGREILSRPKVVPLAMKLHFEHGWCVWRESDEPDVFQAGMPSLVGSESFWKDWAHFNWEKHSRDSERWNDCLDYESSPVGSLAAEYMGYLIEHGDYRTGAWHRCLKFIHLLMVCVGSRSILHHESKREEGSYAHFSLLIPFV